MLSELMVDVYKRLIILKEDILLKAIEHHLGRPFDKDNDVRDFNIIRMSGNEWYAYKGACFGVWSMEPDTFPMSTHIRVSYNFTFKTNPELDKQIKYTNMESKPTLEEALAAKEDSLVAKIVAKTHGGNSAIVETSDFTQGIRAALRYLATAKTEDDDYTKR